MSLLRVVGREIFAAYRQGLVSNQNRTFLTSAYWLADQPASTEAGAEEDPAEDQEKGQIRDDPKDRTRIIPVETSIRYLTSEAYQQTYQGEPVWKQYRRNHKGTYAPKKTRKKCIRQGKLATGNPCPICRDEFLVLDHRNIDLIKQFISAQSGKVLSYQITGLCQKRHLELLVAVERAMDYGLITFDVPFRDYDYSEYYPAQKQ